MGIKEGMKNRICVIPSEEKRSRGISLDQIIWSKVFLISFKEIQFDFCPLMSKCLFKGVPRLRSE